MPPTRILVIDDAATVRLYHQKVLHDAGWATEEACNGLEALERIHAAAQPFGLYVVDVNMPGLDGLNFVRQLRRLEPRHQAPVVMVSTEAQGHDRDAAFAAGANEYLVKPALPHGLALAAALLLGERATALRAAQGGRA